MKEVTKLVHGKVIEPKHIEAVKSHLKRGKENAITMRSLARRMRCSKGAAERRFNAWVKKYLPQDRKVKTVMLREGERGPISTGYYL